MGTNDHFNSKVFTAIYDELLERYKFPCGKGFWDYDKAKKYEKEVASSQLYKTMYGEFDIGPDQDKSMRDHLRQHFESQEKQQWVGASFPVPKLGDDD